MTRTESWDSDLVIIITRGLNSEDNNRFSTDWQLILRWILSDNLSPHTNITISFSHVRVKCMYLVAVHCPSHGHFNYLDLATNWWVLEQKTDETTCQYEMLSWSEHHDTEYISNRFISDLSFSLLFLEQGLSLLFYLSFICAVLCHIGPWRLHHSINKEDVENCTVVDPINTIITHRI